MSAAPAVAHHHPATERVRIPYYSPPLGVTVIRGVGWRATCSCGWRGSVRHERDEARADAGGHLLDGECE